MTYHAAEARGRLERAWARMSGDDSLRPLLRTDAQREQMIATAQVHATLALADEQHTANQLAWLTYRQQGGTIPFGEPGAASLAARLELTPTPPNQEQ